MKRILVFISLDQEGWETHLGGYTIQLEPDLMLFGALNNNPYIGLLNCDEEIIKNSTLTEDIRYYTGDRVFLVPLNIKDLITDKCRQIESLKEITPSSLLLTEVQKKALGKSVIEKISALPDNSIQFLEETMEFELRQEKFKPPIPEEIASSLLSQNCEGTLFAGGEVKSHLTTNTYLLEERIENNDEKVTYEIWKVTQTLTRERYVILFVTQDSFHKREDSLTKLVEQTRQPSSNQIPGIIVPVDLGCISNYVFLVASPLSGVSLDTLINKNPQGLSLEEARPCLEAMKKILVQAHERKQMRLEFLKPTSIFYDFEKKTVTLVDWQVPLPSKERECYKSYETLTNEAGLDKGATADSRDDVYSLACITYKLLSGKHPFAGEIATEAKSQKKELVPINSLNPQQWEALTKGLAFEWAERTETISEFLENFLKKTFYDFVKDMVEAPFFVGLVVGGGLLIFTIIYLYFWSGGISSLELRQVPVMLEKVEATTIYDEAYHWVERIKKVVKKDTTTITIADLDAYLKAFGTDRKKPKYNVATAEKEVCNQKNSSLKELVDKSFKVISARPEQNSAKKEDYENFFSSIKDFVSTSCSSNSFAERKGWIERELILIVKWCEKRCGDDFKTELENYRKNISDPCQEHTENKLSKDKGGQ